MIERINFWGVPHGVHLLGYVVPMVCAVVLAWRLGVRARMWWKVGRPDRRWDHASLRLKRVLKYAIAQVKVLRQQFPGFAHVAIAWGFLVFFLGTALATIDADFIRFLRGFVYLAFKILLDVFTALAIVGVALAAYRRFVQRPERLTLNKAFGFSLGLIFVVVLSGLLTESLRLAAVARDPGLQPGWTPALAWWTPTGWITAQIWLGAGLSPAVIDRVHLATWLGHVGLVGLLLVMVPLSPLLHVLTAPLNVFFSPIARPRGRAAPAAPTDADGAGTLRGFTWAQLMQGDACTECGRCQDACPAHGAGQPLSPKKVVLAIKDSLASTARALRGNGSQGSKTLPAFVGGAVEDAAAWACTTCRACVTECPVLIEHVDTILDMRRHLLARQRADNQLTTALGNLRRYGNSFGKSDKQRAKWTTGLSFKVKDIRRQPARTLWYVGDYASYSPALTEATQATARVFQQAGIDFGLLYDAERNAANDLRRAGEEGLFELLAQKNVAVMGKCEFQEIVTTDPHTYNTLKNEYAWDGRNVTILHYSELLDRAVREGTLRIRRTLSHAVTYHDPCYLGRYNDVYDAPRRLLRAIGCRLVEMPRNRDRALCCGAGGGRIWMDEGQVKERPSESRVREAAALNGVRTFVVACPKDLTMYRDAVKTAGLESTIVVKDLIELVEEATREEPAAAPAKAEAGAGA
jgi:Fe-S oxidoreductase/nitrate reductase gamma subunit